MQTLWPRVAHAQARDVQLAGGRQSKNQIVESQTFPFVGVEESEGAEEEEEEEVQEEDLCQIFAVRIWRDRARGKRDRERRGALIPAPQEPELQGVSCVEAMA